MKKYQYRNQIHNFAVIFLLLLGGLVGHTQNGDRFTLSAYTEPQLYFNDGFNVGSRLEYQRPIWYIKFEVYAFPGLNGIDYFDFDGGVGLNWRSKWDNWRIYLGADVGAINRLGWGHPKSGLESGIEYYSSLGFYLGAKLSRVSRGDGRAWESEAEIYSTWDLGLTIGYYW